MSFKKSLCLGLLGTLLCFSLLTFGLTISLKSTILKPQFMVDETKKLDISLALSEFLTAQISMDESLMTAIDRSTIESESWIRRQLIKAVYSCYDYLLGKTNTLKMSISLNTFNIGLIDNLEKVYQQFPPSEYLALPEAERKAYLDGIKQDILNALPVTLEITASDLGDDIMKVLQQCRNTVVYINSGFWWLIGTIVVLLCLLAVILRRLEDILRSLGIILVVTAALTFLLVVLFQNVILPGLYPHDMVPELQVWLPTLVSDILFPACVYGPVLLAGGILLLAGSTIIARKRVAVLP